MTRHRPIGIFQSRIQGRMCVRCRGCSLNCVSSVNDLSNDHVCPACKKVDKSHFTKYKLHPVWYKRVKDATHHSEFKKDSSGNLIARYDQPSKLLSLTVAEKLLIRRCAPYIPALHLHYGFLGMKGHAVAFEQDVGELCNTQPQRKENILTFIRRMGSKSTHSVHLTHLRVRRQKVL